MSQYTKKSGRGKLSQRAVAPRNAIRDSGHNAIKMGANVVSPPLVNPAALVRLYCPARCAA